VDTDPIRFPAGVLTRDQLAAAFSAIPADVTFIDADGIVRYYSEYRIFSRTRDCLDRDVLECHPSATRAGVAQLVGELRDGWREEALFLTEKNGRPVSVRYSAVRDAGGAYLGCLEVAQWADEVGGAVSG